MKKSRVIFTVVVLLLIVACFVFAKVFNDLKKETKIKNEIKEIVKVLGTENIDDDGVNAILERRIYEKGNYAIVEDAIKNYYHDLYSSQKNITFLMDEDNFITYLDVKNIKDDGPSFTKSVNNLQTTKAQLNDKYENIKKHITCDPLKVSYIYNKDVDSYYKNLYLEFINEYTPSTLEQDMETKYNNTLKLIDLYNDAFAFLTANKAHWKIVDDVLTFDDTVLYDSYKEITDKVDKLHTKNNKVDEQTS